MKTMLRLLRHYDQFSHVVSRKKAVIQRTYFCLVAASGNLYKGLHMFYSYQRHKFALMAFLCNPYCLCTADSDM